MFTPLTTARLTIRAMTPEDGEILWRRRNDPVVAEYQDWSLPFPREKADEIARSCAEMAGPRKGEWWMAMVDLTATGESVGDLAVHLADHGHEAEIGYTFAKEHWGNGYAVEAAEALVEYLFETVGVDRVFGMLHPDNTPSARVLERLGMEFEGHTKLSYWLNDEGSDDWIYGMTRPMWEAWINRPRTTDEVRLIEVTADNVVEVLRLETHRTQRSFVATMAKSFAQALRPGDYEGKPIEPWFRAIEADGELAGFMMVALIEGDPPFLWRLLIDRMHQRRGVATKALALLEDEMRGLGYDELLVSWHPGRGTPQEFYLSRGFELTGKEEGGELEAKKAL